jgi:hypothetical protein
LLISKGAEITPQVFKSLVEDEDAVRFCLDNGLDPNFNNFAPFRKVTKGSWINKDQIGESYFDAFKMLLKYGAKLSDERGRNMIIKWAGEYARFDILEYLRENGQAKSFTDADWKDGILWINHSRKINEEKKKEVLDYLQSQIKEK